MMGRKEPPPSQLLLRLAFLVALTLPGGSWAYTPIFTEEMLSRRSISRFTRGHEDNALCWNRSVTEDSFISPIDGHNHIRPFGGPAVPWEMYLDWMREHGILFTTMFGIGQQLIHDKRLPMCCYYFHCPSKNYMATPDPINDELNAVDYENWTKNPRLQEQIHLTLSATFPNLQVPDNNTKILQNLETKHPGAFKWSGEINVFKHALSANGFFDGPRVTLARVEAGYLDGYFRKMEETRWPVTLHSDIGCDITIHEKTAPTLNNAWQVVQDECQVPQDELRLAQENNAFWKGLLGHHYPAFFDGITNEPKKNFIKIQHLQVWDAILRRYPRMVVVWAHMGLCKELRTLHPLVHSHVMMELFRRHPNLYTDVSWDVLPKLLLMNYDESRDSADDYHSDNHEDFDEDAATFLFNTTHVEELRRKLHLVWEDAGHRGAVHATGSGPAAIGGPTYAMALYLNMFETFKDRFITGTDFVASYGSKRQYPGELGASSRGCMKDKANHARQVTDTSSINIFMSDAAFSSIVLGGNFFKITGLSGTYAPPPVCPFHETALSSATKSGSVASTAILLTLALSKIL